MTAERPTADGTVGKEPDGSTTIRFDRRLRHPIERVWQALTDPDELRRWWGDTRLEPVEGGPFQLRWRNTDENGDVAHPGGDHHRHRPAAAPRDLRQVKAPDQDVPTAAGWHLHLDALATILAGGDVDIAHPDDLFAPIHQAYTEKYGPGPEPSDDGTPEASTASEASKASKAARRARLLVRGVRRPGHRDGP
jgi:hypothetical protein